MTKGMPFVTYFTGWVSPFTYPIHVKVATVPVKAWLVCMFPTTHLDEGFSAEGFRAGFTSWDLQTSTCSPQRSPSFHQGYVVNIRWKWTVNCLTNTYNPFEYSWFQYHVFVFVIPRFWNSIICGFLFFRPNFLNRNRNLYNPCELIANRLRFIAIASNCCDFNRSD